MIIKVDLDAWYPAQHDAGHQSTAKLTPGQIIIWQRDPYRVVDVRPLDPANWPDKFLTKWTDAGCPDTATWHHRPLVMAIRREADDNTQTTVHLQCTASVSWRTLPEHYHVCRRCGELPPCREVHNNTVAERASERFEQQMAIMPGCCHSCHEPITSRQKYHRFTGPNLIRPDLGNDSALFHLRGSCHGGLRAYDKRWADAEPGRRRNFYCDGHLVHHHDDTKTCSNVECPSTEVEHHYIEWHQPGVHAKWMGCWCVSGDLTARLDNASGEQR